MLTFQNLVTEQHFCPKSRTIGVARLFLVLFTTCIFISVHVHMLNLHLAAVKWSSQHWSWDVNTHSHSVLFLAKLQRQTFTKLCCMSRISTSQKWFNGVYVWMCTCVCVNVSKCTRAETCAYISQDFLSYTDLSSQNNAADSILSAAWYNLFQSACLAVQSTNRQPTIASSVYYCQQANCQQETHPTVLIPCFHKAVFFSLQLIKAKWQ